MSLCYPYFSGLGIIALQTDAGSGVIVHDIIGTGGTLATVIGLYYSPAI
tara:strand:+ start:831 stop:977 length:147 start_codon:yes stop_codon:yes gene_type:complete